MRWLKIDWTSFARTLPWYPGFRRSIYDPNPLFVRSDTLVEYDDR